LWETTQVTCVTGSLSSTCPTRRPAIAAGGTQSPPSWAWPKTCVEVAVVGGIPGRLPCWAVLFVKSQVAPRAATWYCTETGKAVRGVPGRTTARLPV